MTFIRLLALSVITALTVNGCQLQNRPASPPVKKDLTKDDIEQMMTDLSNWNRWGPDDELGALNLITPAKRRAAAQLVRDGVSISLAHNVIKEAVDSSPPFNHTMRSTGESPSSSSTGDVFSVEYHGFTQTHVDALCHLFHKGKMYNGYPQTLVTKEGAGKLSVVAMKDGIFTRGVLMDIPRLLGKEYLEGDRAIYPEDLEAWEEKAGMRVQSGDAVLIRTGRWTRRAETGTWEMMQNSAGLHVSCVPWLKARDVAVIGSDLALDVMPSGIDGFPLPVHWVMIIAMGVPILDNLDFETVSAAASERGRFTFLLTVAPLAVDGGTGSPINPIATF